MGTFFSQQETRLVETLQTETSWPGISGRPVPYPIRSIRSGLFIITCNIKQQKYTSTYFVKCILLFVWDILWISSLAYVLKNKNKSHNRCSRCKLHEKWLNSDQLSQKIASTNHQFSFLLVLPANYECVHIFINNFCYSIQERYSCTRLKLHPTSGHFLAQSHGNYIALFSVNRPFKMNKAKRFEGHKVSSLFHMNLSTQKHRGLKQVFLQP